MHVLQFFFSEAAEDAAMTTQRAAMQRASNQGVRTALRRAMPLFRWDASEAPDGLETIVLISCSLQEGMIQFSARQNGRRGRGRGRRGGCSCRMGRPERFVRGDTSQSSQVLCARSAHAATQVKGGTHMCGHLAQRRR